MSDRLLVLHESTPDPSVRHANVAPEQTYDQGVASETDLVTLYGSARPVPDDGRREEITVTRATYEEARDAVYARVPEGWQLLGLSTWPC